MVISILDNEIGLSEINRIEAYKVDQMTYDTICFDIWFNDKIVTISEDNSHFDTLDNLFSKELINYHGNWRKKVTMPPFQENRTVVFEKCSTSHNNA